MKVLLVNKFLYPKGGSETYVFKLGETLSDHGHEVEYFGLDDVRNIVENSSGQAVSSMDFSKGMRANLRAPLRIIYSAEARRKLKLVLEHFQPDVVHLNNIQFHLTPSLMLAVRDYRNTSKKPVKLVSTAHDYQLICPSHGLFDCNVQVCERCLNGCFFHCLRTKCVKNSYLKSFLAMLDAYVWKHSKAYEELDAIICPSDFLKSKLDTQERFRSKTTTIHNFVDEVEDKQVEKGNYVLEFGHLSEDKGTLTVLEAAEMLPEIPFVFAGYGAAETNIAQVKNATYVGFKTGKELEDLVRKATLTIHPSRCYENCPFSVIESQMYGTPVIGSRMGGLPELVQEGETGLLFEAGNAAELTEKISQLYFNEELLSEYSANCKKAVFETRETYYEKLMNVYGG